MPADLRTVPLNFLETADWQTPENIRDVVGEPPRELAQIIQREDQGVIARDYPARWPFPPPRLP